MYREKYWLCKAALGLVLLMLTACGTPEPTPIAPPTATPVPTATQEPTATPEPPTDTPLPEVVEWDYVAIAPFIWYPYSPEAFYANYIETDLGVEVNLTAETMHNPDKDCTINTEILEGLRNDGKLRILIQEAEVVTVQPSTCDVYYLVTQKYMLERCGGEDNLDCVPETLKSYRESCDAIYEEILSLSNPGTIVRTMTIPHGHLRPYVDTDLDPGPFYILFNEEIVESAAAHNISIARVDIAFHGPEGIEDAVAKGFMPDNIWALSLEGMRVIADLYRDLGYEPTVK